MENEKMHLSWDEIEQLAAELAGKIRTSGFQADCLLGIAVGGLVPLTLLAKELDTKNVVTISARSYDSLTEQSSVRITALPDIDLRGKNILLVDEITDHGTTMQRVLDLVREKYGPKELQTATLVCKKHSTHRPDFYALETEKWVVFPWEKLEWRRG